MTRARSPINKRTLHAVLALARRRARWLLRPPRVRGAMPRMFPGALRMDEREEEAVVEAVREVMRSRRLFRYYGPSPSPFQRSRVTSLEQAFADRVGTRHALAVNSGTSALVCGLIGLGVGPGDETVVPAYTWYSSAGAALAVGAVPVIAEVDDSLTLDPADVARKLSPHTKAIVPVHMRGAPARMDVLNELARERRLLVLEDVAQAAGGSFLGEPLGSIGDAAAFSFQMSKTMTAGEGGMVTTSDQAVQLRAAMYHDTAVCPHLGVSTDDWLPGLNLRMSELHAAVLLVQLDRLDRMVSDMQTGKARLKERIRDALESRGVSFRTIHDPSGDTSTALVFFLPEPGRVKEVTAALADENIPASRLYQDLELLPHDHVDLHVYSAWTPILRRRAWTDAGAPWSTHPREISYSTEMCPRTIELLRRAIHVDLSPDLTEEQVEQMAGGIVAVIEKRV